MAIDYSWLTYLQPRKNKFRELAESKKISVSEQLRKWNEHALSSNPSINTGVYVFHSKINDMIYIGSATEGIERRYLEHIKALVQNRHINWMFQMLYHKYGLDNFSFYILEFCPRELCKELEAKYIQDLDPEINIKGVRGNTLGMDLKSMEEQNVIHEEWMQTDKGKEYKRNTIDKKREKWAKTEVGRKCIESDLKNIGYKLNKTNMTLEDKLEVLFDWYMEYFPTQSIEKETLLKFLKNGNSSKILVTICPLLSRAGY